MVFITCMIMLNKKEKDHQKKLVADLQKEGYLVKHIEDFIHDPGRPDIEIHLPGNKIFFLELKVCSIVKWKKQIAFKMFRPAQYPWYYKYLKETGNTNLYCLVYFDKHPGECLLYQITLDIVKDKNLMLGDLDGVRYTSFDALPWLTEFLMLKEI